MPLCHWHGQNGNTASVWDGQSQLPLQELKACALPTASEPGWHPVQGLWIALQPQGQQQQLCTTRSWLRAHSASAVSDWHLCLTSIWSWKGGKAVVSFLPPSDLNFAFCFTLMSEDFTPMAPDPEVAQGGHKKRHIVTAWTQQYPVKGRARTIWGKASGETEALVNSGDTFLTTLPLAVAGLSYVNSSGKDQLFSSKYLQYFLARRVQLSLSVRGEKANYNYKNF